ncbi:hypothetical protein PG993_009895 [Apiospora rasikravindrae]|uniref:F-box domain-containing protein n=1 Tax=Apiospora rasikravindrae TaxID=990691 RepID=A0ABR1SKM6_9PEZI
MELWYEVHCIILASNPASLLWFFQTRMGLRTLMHLSHTCRDLRILCTPWWYQAARATASRPWDPFNCLLVQAASHGNVEVLRQAIGAGFEPWDLKKTAFTFRWGSNRRIRTKRWDFGMSDEREATLVEITILGEAASHQKVSFLKWIQSLGIPLEEWYVQWIGSPSLLRTAVEVGELDVIEYLAKILPTGSPLVDNPETLFGIALGNNAPNDTLEYLMRRLKGSPVGATRQDWSQTAINNQNFRGLEFIITHERLLGVGGKRATRELLKIVLDAALRRERISNGDINFINLALRWSVGTVPNAKKRRIHYPIGNFTNALRCGRSRKRRLLAYIVKRLAKDHRVTWTDASEGEMSPGASPSSRTAAAGRRAWKMPG